ncbi:hypothetical protein [Streptomyces sp. NBC_01760]|uniref:hypothetical protein n=1 Tax=Streptomyces sp. NBC_01760 TaxID=2975931 RepID=UPI002DD9C807|nr:hypothetical protein [Streptomyces sp. NBC_01760]WSC72112.1 hypothetical protein OG807_28600 [Streptomyces sp. NBC_01760]
MASPTLGRIVLYRLSEQDASNINRRRKDFRNSGAGADRTGFIGHIGNPAVEGQLCPAQIVRIFDDSMAVNLQVALDGNDQYWATSRTEGTDPGTWAWPEVS